MNSFDFTNPTLLDEWPYRICLPYGADLLQLARWVDDSGKDRKSYEFDIIVGDQIYAGSGSNAIELFNDIQKRCINYSLLSSWVICKQPASMMFFDMYGRFSFFSAELNVLQNLYPFSREIMWENFVLDQEEDDDAQLAEIFQAVHSV